MIRGSFIASLCAAILLAAPALAIEEAPYVPLEQEPDEQTLINPNKYTLVEYFTADTLELGETKLGLDFEYSPWTGFMIGTDLLSLAVGAPTIQMKKAFWKNDEHRISLGLVAAFYDKSTALWGRYSDHFEELQATIVRPSVSWTHRLSSRLNLHTYWSVGFGKPKATLTEKGQRALWESKNPGGDWETRETETDDTLDKDKANNNTNSNQEERSHKGSLSNRTLQLQTLTGMLSDIFSITGEFKREADKKILITTRIEQSILEDLKSNGFRITAAQQWVFSSLQFRIGVGLQYQVLSGRDLDGEEVNDSGVYPATDIDFYWRF